MGKVWTDEECEPFDTVFRSALVNKVVDADTFDLRVFTGFGTLADTRVRLLGEGVLLTPLDARDDGVDAWEVKGEEREKGVVAKARVEALVHPGDEVRIFSKRGGKLDGLRRYLAMILVNTMPGGWVSLGDLLVEEGHATPWTRA
jgi:endonuclease YncB( thermonuclease family)